VVSSADESESLAAREPGDGEGPKGPSLVGETIAERYEIEHELGRGGMGTVYRARHVTLGRPVAVKVLHPKLTADPAVSKRFDREALAASKLDHPNCVQVIDFGTTGDGMKYLVMQFLEGKELRDELGWPMNPRRAARLGSQILRALEHAHRKGLVHRDMKPENVFIVRDDDGQEHVKLVDFGIVKLLDADGSYEKLTRAGLVFGTPRYMAPEQAAGGKIDERTDLYAVGVLLHEMLAGKPPFDADEATIVLRMHMLSDPPPLPDEVPAAIGAVVNKLLAKVPGDRHGSAKEAREALEAAVDAASAPSEAVEQPLVASLNAPAPPLRVSPVVPAPASAAVPVPSPAAVSTSQPTVAVSPLASTSQPTMAVAPPLASTSQPTMAVAPPSASMSAPMALPPSGTFKTVLALEAQSDLRLPRRRTGGLAITIMLVAAGLGAWAFYAMSDCTGGATAPKDGTPRHGAAVESPDAQREEREPSSDPELREGKAHAEGRSKGRSKQKRRR
jgi:eukaryotic-like serine/threonine-protein kinase